MLKATQKVFWQREKRDLRKPRALPVRVPAELAPSSVERAENTLSALAPMQFHLESRASTPSSPREALMELKLALQAMSQISDLLSMPQEHARTQPGQSTGFRGLQPIDRPWT